METAAGVASSSRVGVFGGTFDPPHLGHARAASEALRVLALDRVLWVPSHLSPHKRDHASSPPGVRWEMVCAALRGEPSFEATRAEMDCGGVSYTIDTLRQLRASQPQRELFLILGPDLIDGFGSWEGTGRDCPHRPVGGAALRGTGGAGRARPWCRQCFGSCAFACRRPGSVRHLLLANSSARGAGQDRFAYGGARRLGHYSE